MDTQHGRPCSLAAALGLVGDRWALLAVREVMFGNHRFGEIARNTAAPRDRLAARLKALVDAGILERRQYQSSPPRHDYHLTAAGRELVPVMHALRAWGDKWAVGEPPLRAEHHGHPIHPHVVCATCGEPVRAEDLEFIFTVPDWDITGPKRPVEASGEESSATTPRRRRPAHQSRTNSGLMEKR
jgi:DNA-binding HxlR family transcriptional regulator